MIKDFTEEEIRKIIQQSSSYKEILVKLGYKGYSSQNKIIKKYCQEHNISLSHLTHTTLKNLIGQKYGRLLVLERDISKPSGHQKSVYWLCKCDCGNIISTTSYHLISGNTCSCGCLQKERTSEACRLDLTNQKYGKLTVIKPAESIKEKSGTVRSAWLCKCDCGKEVIVKTINLRSGDTKSCGCLYSKGEYIIQKLLENNNILYKKEYSFSDLITSKGYPMRFDFAILDNKGSVKKLIEFQGRQHYEDGEWSNSISLKERQARDKKKKEYCLKNNIPLLVIPYWEINNINIDYLIKEI